MNIPQALQQSLHELQSGHSTAAEPLLLQVLAQDRKNFDALHLLGLCRHQRGDFAGAERLLRAAGKLRPGVAAVHVSLGNALREQGRLAEATLGFRRATQIDPRLSAGHYNLAMALDEAGAHAEALASFDRALALRAEAPSNAGRGNCLVALGRRVEAIEAYRAALALDPLHVNSHANLAGLLVEDPGTRELAYQHAGEALRLRPGHPGAVRVLVRVLNEQHRWEEVLQLLGTLAHGPSPGGRGESDAWALLERARALAGIGEPSQAIAVLEELLRSEFPPPGARLELATLLAMTDRAQEAEAHFAALEREHPGDAAIAFQRGLVAHGRGDLCGARRAFAQGIEKDKGLPGGRFHLATIDLLEGRFAAGWAGLESRWELPAYARLRKDFARPLWLGEEEIRGRTLFVWAEQGLGDAVQFSRFLPLLAARGARVIAEVPGAFVSLLRRSLGSSVEVLDIGAPIPSFDLHVPMLSLGLALGLDAESDLATAPWLRADEARVALWQGRLGRVPGPRIGLAWAGNPQHRNDARRSAALDTFEPLLRALRARHGARGYQLVSLQTQLPARDRAALAAHPEIFHFGEAIGSLEDTAALAACCELIVSVDTLAAHLAGAMGLAGRVLLPFVPDWRWFLARTDSPWYPSLRLLRQESAGDWESVARRLASELAGEGA